MSLKDPEEKKQIRKETIMLKENSLKEGSEAGYSFSTNTNNVRKQRKFLSTKTYTTKNDVNSTITNK